MWKQRPVPAFLHEVFGLTQSPAEALGTLVFGVAAVVLLSSMAETPASLPLWRWALGWLLVADVAAGCAANFTRIAGGSGISLKGTAVSETRPR